MAEMICESVLVKIKFNNFYLHVMGVYRSPHTNLENTIEILSAELEKISNPNNPIVILGDTNVDDLTEGPARQKLTDALEGFNLRRIKLPPTRITHLSKTSIDAVCTNLNEELLSCKVITTGLSDHTAQMCHITAKRENSTSTKSKQRVINKHKMEEIRSILAAQNWADVTTKESTEAAFTALDSVLRFALDSTCPNKTVKIKRTQPRRVWDAECEELKTAYLEALNQEILSGNVADKNITAQRKKNYDLKLKDLRKKYNADIIEQAENKSKALWKVINAERKGKGETPHLESLNVEGSAHYSPKRIADCLNSFFVTIADRTLQQNKKEEQSISNYPDEDILFPNLQLYNTTEKEVENVIDRMKPKTSAGEDEISSKLIKYCKNELIPPLTILINKSLNEGIFPRTLKTAKVYPKYKNGGITEATSYRPISLISNFSKILERVVLNRLTEHLHQLNLLTPKQHGFIKNRSTATAITQLIESLIDRLEQGHIASTILLDFSKAFDCLDHKLIIKKLTTLGITGKEAQWFESYTCDRKQLVEITYENNHLLQKIKSEVLPINRGVPQGSVLGPVLYILLTNDFPKYLEDFCETVMFADDTALIVSNKNQDQMELDSRIAYNMTKQYCYQNDLVLNEKKTFQLILTTTPNHHDGLPDITTVSSNKYLGVILDNNLTWTPHINQLCKKLNTALFVIRRMKQISDEKTSLTAYYSLFESNLRYGLVAWGGTSNTNLQRVLTIQKRAIRTLNSLGPRDTCRQAFKKLRILTVASLYILETVLSVVKSSQTRMEDQHPYNTRHGHNFLLDAHHLSLYEKKPSYRGAIFYNNLPENLKRLTEKKLKIALKNWLLDRSIYTIQEYLNWRNQ